MYCPCLCRVEWLGALPSHLEPSASTKGSDSREASAATGRRSHRATSTDGGGAVRRATRASLPSRRWRYPHPVGRTSAGDVGAFAPAQPRRRRLLVPATRGPRAKRCGRTVSCYVNVLDWRDRVSARLLRSSRLQSGLQAVAQINAASISRTVPGRTRDPQRERLIRARCLPSMTIATSPLVGGPLSHSAFVAALLDPPQ